MRYEITVIIDSGPDYTNGDQIEDLKDDIEMTIADYNCFCQIGDIKVREIAE